jgi:hypothetical protein
MDKCGRMDKWLCVELVISGSLAVITTETQHLEMMTKPVSSNTRTAHHVYGRYAIEKM